MPSKLVSHSVGFSRSINSVGIFSASRRNSAYVGDIAGVEIIRIGGFYSGLRPLSREEGY
jgi:hypothetical protein